jgi:hypothetical protein
MATPTPNEQFKTPTEILKLHPILKNRYGWSENGIGWLLSMNIIQGQRIQNTCRIYYPSVINLIRFMNDYFKNMEIPTNQ